MCTIFLKQLPLCPRL